MKISLSEFKTQINSLSLNLFGLFGEWLPLLSPASPSEGYKLPSQSRNSPWVICGHMSWLVQSLRLILITTQYMILHELLMKYSFFKATTLCRANHLILLVSQKTENQILNLQVKSNWFMINYYDWSLFKVHTHKNLKCFFL